MAHDEQPLPDDQAWFDALNGKGDSGQAARLRQVLRAAELEAAAQEDVTHDWQRLQFALRREKAKPESTISKRNKYYPMAASVLIVVCASSVIFETIKEPSYSPSEPAPVAVALPPPVAHAPPAVASPPAAATHGTTEQAKAKAAAKQDERENEEARQLMSRQVDTEMMRERSVQMEESAAPRAMMAAPVMMAPQPAPLASPKSMMAPPVTVESDKSEQMVSTATPEQDADQVKAELAKLGVGVVKGILLEDSFVLFITLTYPVKAEVRAVLEAHTIQVPEQGELAVVFEKSRP